MLPNVSDYMHPLAGPFRLDGELPATVLLLHGWTGSPAHMRDLGLELNDAGYTVVAPLLAGHGTTLEDMAGTGWRDWVRSAADPAFQVLESGDVLHLVGLSMGGIIALLLSLSLEVGSVTTINAPQLVRDHKARLAGLYRGSARIDRTGQPVPAPPEMQKYQQQYDGTPVGTAAELTDLIRAARHNLGRVTCPVLVIQSKSDETVRPRSAEIIYDGLGSAHKGLVWLERSRHVAVLDVERDVIVTAILDHLGVAVGPGATDLNRDSGARFPG
jgi:carboxylesterase